ncbi:hypothetical protein ATY81_25110 [Rhizobium sp. R72]|uniref:protease modulator HflK n=1 Tax=unclassified Rhizobium TaxID=2613769 RepID=UPI000B53220D|nr:MULTISPECIES: protease modulator HflK [unclassified Rhizobium]OWW00083.1 hypothetical protein ATY81_25110 [Rhizobium sp. R72]OWW00474.1 hypothetical protein ATY80_25110 [Rhizobium sp. R711]
MLKTIPDTPIPHVKDQPNFQLAAAQAHDLARQGVSIAFLAALFLFAALIANALSLSTIWVTFFCNNAAALILFGAGIRSAYDIAEWRRKTAGIARLPLGGFAQWLIAFVTAPWTSQEATEPDRIERWSGSVLRAAGSLLSHIGARPLLDASFSLLACLMVYTNWALTADDVTIGAFAIFIISICLAFAFLFLVTERRFAAIEAAEWPEAKAISHMARVPIVTLVVSCFCLFLAARGSALSTKFMAAAGGFVVLVALELLLRATVSIFRPQGEAREPALIVDSLLAGCLQWPPQPRVDIQSELRTKTGIDLRQVWAFSFIRKTAPAIVLATALIGWVLSGIREIPMTGRGVYERFGRAERILEPGLHIGFPWPFGRIVPVENGTVHELATSVSTNPSQEPRTDAEGPAPDSSNRLWDSSHVSEKSQIIASDSGSRQSFEIVDMDVRFVYRIGLSDEAAMKAAYRIGDLPALIESAANHILVHEFAGRTLNDVLSKGRLSLAHDIGSALQKDMDSLDSGVEILAVVVEAIHPPAGASNAFHEVQAAQIRAEALVAHERGTAAERKNTAQLNASLAEDNATVAARQNIAASDVARLRFQAEQSAYRDAGKAFLTEMYFDQLTSGLSRSKALVLDHRIGGNTAPTLDLRRLMLPSDPDTSTQPSPLPQREETSP